MASFDWFPWYPVHYRRATRHLTDMQDLIYRRLIDEYMETREPLPDNDIALASITRVCIDEWKMARAILLPFFRQSDGKLHHKKCSEILEEQQAVSRKKSQAGSAGAAKRWKKPIENTETNSTSHSAAIALPMANDGTLQDTTGQESKKDPVVDRGAEVERIFSWLEQFLNSPTPFFTAPVSAWITWGADFDLDIKPVAERWRKANPKKAIRSLEWLDDGIAASIRKRTKPMPEETEKETYANRNQQSKPNSVGKRLAALYRAGTGSGEGERMEPDASERQAGFEPERKTGAADGMRTSPALAAPGGKTGNHGMSGKADSAFSSDEHGGEPVALAV
jgi:uncharacterized protein YdaU (DUF1376 family)